MQIIDNLIIISLIVTAFILGMKVDARYHRNALAEQKEALERQFMRLRVNADADDPCKPYYTAVRGYAPQYQQVPPMPVEPNQGDFDGDQFQPISPSFMEDLSANGRAKTSFRKSDIYKQSPA